MHTAYYLFLAFRILPQFANETYPEGKDIHVNVSYLLQDLMKSLMRSCSTIVDRKRWQR